MCGIAGFLSLGLDPLAAPGILRKMLARLVHRGPDGTGMYVDDAVALGTTRLSILDIEGGNQPLSDPTGRYWIAYNGELYNYLELRRELEAEGCTFATQSDTEVVIQAWARWGSQCLPRFNGGYAFAILDRETATLALARDRFGKRPLFYTSTPQGVLFASEMKAFLGFPGFSFERDVEQVASILACWTPLPHQTGFLGVEALPPGSWLKLGRGGATVQRYASLAFNPPPFVGDEAGAEAEVAEALRRSVELRLRSDVEVGVYLSGGIDSAVVAHLAQDLTGRPLRSFSVEFEDAGLDEAPAQRTLSEHFGGEHRSLRISSADITQALPAALFHAEVPAFRSAFVPMYLLSRLVQEEGIKVVLSGEGADEAFLGYEIFKETRLRASWKQLDGPARRAGVASLYSYLPHFDASGPLPALGLYQQFSEERLPGLFSHELRFQNGRFATRLLREPGETFAPLIALAAAEPGYAELGPVQKAQWLEYKTLLSGYLLSTQGERMSLAHGVENRCPFLDPAVLAVASATNATYGDREPEKYLLRRAFRHNIPSEIVARKKHPYRAPDSVAFVDAPPAYLELALSDNELAKLGYLDTRFARALVKKIQTAPAEKISTKENQAFMSLVSLLLLDHQFVQRRDLPPLHPASERPLVRFVDKRTRKPEAA